MTAMPMGDDELRTYAELHGARGVYQAGYDLAVNQMRGQSNEAYEFVRSVHSIMRELGIAPVLGMSYEDEILAGLQIIAHRQQQTPST